jgi:hypothetical protein
MKMKLFEEVIKEAKLWTDYDPSTDQMRQADGSSYPYVGTKELKAKATEIADAIEAVGFFTNVYIEDEGRGMCWIIEASVEERDTFPNGEQLNKEDYPHGKYPSRVRWTNNETYDEIQHCKFQLFPPQRFAGFKKQSTSISKDRRPSGWKSKTNETWELIIAGAVSRDVNKIDEETVRAVLDCFNGDKLIVEHPGFLIDWEHIAKQYPNVYFKTNGTRRKSGY